MKNLMHFKKDIRKCAKCGLCQAECPIYKITGNDCSVSRGMFMMLDGILQGDLKMSGAINRYLDLCLKCGACSKFCPSGIDIVDVIIAAKQEYFRGHPLERIKTFFKKYLIFGLLPRIIRTFVRPTKSKKFDKKVLYFGGCGSKFKGDKAVVKFLNLMNIEVINPQFHCCGVPYFSSGDLEQFGKSMNSYVRILKKYDIKEVVTACASCEMSLKEYIKWAEGYLSEEDICFLKEIKVKNIYEYSRENNTKLSLRKPIKVTYHKPCNVNNYSDVEWLLKNVENLEYVEMKDYDKCCGLNGLSNFKEYKIMSKIFADKRQAICDTNAEVVLTSCLGCEVAMTLYSKGKYRVKDLIEFIIEG